MSIVLLMGKSSFLITGYNLTSKVEKVVEMEQPRSEINKSERGCYYFFLAPGTLILLNQSSTFFLFRIDNNYDGKTAQGDCVCLVLFFNSLLKMLSI
jgi:hypothetical protein